MPKFGGGLLNLRGSQGYLDLLGLVLLNSYNSNQFDEIGKFACGKRTASPDDGWKQFS